VGNKEVVLVRSDIELVVRAVGDILKRHSSCIGAFWLQAYWAEYVSQDPRTQNCVTFFGNRGLANVSIYQGLVRRYLAGYCRQRGLDGRFERYGLPQPVVVLVFSVAVLQTVPGSSRKILHILHKDNEDDHVEHDSSGELEACPRQKSPAGCSFANGRYTVPPCLGRVSQDGQ